MPDTQTLLVIVILLLVLNIAIAALVAMVITQNRDTLIAYKPNGAPSNTQLIETMAGQVAGIDRELMPKEGASLSFRVNKLGDDTGKLAEDNITMSANSRSAVEEARNAQQRASDERARVERLLTTLQTTIDNLLLSTARATEAAVKIIQNTVAGTQTSVEATNSKIDQLAAGSGIEQAHTQTTLVADKSKPASGVEMAKEGLGTTKEGVEQIEKGIDKLKGTKK